MGLEPWDTVVKWCTVNMMALTHTPIIVIDREDRQAQGRHQLLDSMRRECSLGLPPKCGNSICHTHPGDVMGMDTRANTALGEHAKMQLFCKHCKYHAMANHPAWMTLAHKTCPHFFVTLWPLTETQITKAQCLNQKWTTHDQKGELIEAECIADVLSQLEEGTI